MSWWSAVKAASAEILEAMAFDGPNPAARPVHARIDEGAIPDPVLRIFLEQGRVSGAQAMRIPAVYRCVDLISSAIAMLPLHLMERDAAVGKKAETHPLYRVLMVRPNNWQTPFQFKRLMERRKLIDGNAYALPIWAGRRVSELIPLPGDRVRIEQQNDWSVLYIVRLPGGGEARYKREQIFHLMGPSDDGIKGMSLASHASDSFGLSLSAQEAARKIFERGMSAGGALKTDKSLSTEAIARMKDSLSAEYSGAENAGRWMILEEGLTPHPFGMSGRDAQGVEQRNFQIEDVCRIFGVPRPFAFLDDTSWGTGIEQLALFFVCYALAPRFVEWEQAVSLSLLAPVKEEGRYYAKFNERALLRGSMKDQAEFWGKLLGAGGTAQVMEANEIREQMDLAPHPDGGGLFKPQGQQGA